MSETQERFIELIESRALRNKIRETGLTFSDMELLRIAYFYSPDFDSRIENMLAVAENANEQNKAYAMRLISAQKEAFDRLARKEDLGIIYELYVQDDQGNEKINFCSSYKAALWLVVVTNREQGKSENGIKYNLVKRYISKRDDSDKTSANIAEAVLLSEGKLYSVEIDDLPAECDGECETCGRPCLYREDILFPCFLEENQLVSYKDLNGEIKYGIVAQECDELLESCRVLSLESPALVNGDYINGEFVSKFIAPPFIEPIDESDLPDEMYKAYEEYTLHLTERAILAAAEPKEETAETAAAEAVPAEQ